LIWRIPETQHLQQRLKNIPTIPKAPAGYFSSASDFRTCIAAGTRLAGLGGPGKSPAFLFLGLLAMPFAGRRRRWTVVLVAMLALAGGLWACNDLPGISATGTPAGTYEVVITASSPGCTPAATTLTLTVR
jgi:hypothetical protein